MFKTVVCDICNIEYPIFQGGMAWVSDASLASAVSNAGGLGIIAAGNAPPDYVKGEIRKAKKLTDKPFGLNVMLMSPYVDEVAQAAADENIEIVITGAGSPAKYMPLWQEKGIKVIPVVASTAMAKIAERNGAAAIIAEGMEAGGHIGELTTMALLPQVVDTVNVPVIAAGGLADARSVAAAFMLGASGVQLGTRFLVAKECTIHQNYKNMVLKAKDIDTIATGKTIGHPVRALKNIFSKTFHKKEYDGTATAEELEKFGAGALKLAAVDGDIANGCFMAGQIAGLVKNEQSAKEIIDDLVTNSKKIINEVSVK